MNIYEKLLAVQCELKAPKAQYNKFGNYPYRNCEDILEAAKPVLQKYKALAFLTDDIEVKGDRYYVKATATFIDVESGEKLITTAFAREEETKKGMDGSQVTGASSSYARKYALNGLFDIDDTKDSDTTNKGDDEPKPEKKPTKPTASKPKEPKDALAEIKKQINSTIVQYRSLTGTATKPILEEINEALGFPVDSIKTEDEGKAVIDYLLRQITAYQGKGA